MPSVSPEFIVTTDALGRYSVAGPSSGPSELQVMAVGYLRKTIQFSVSWLDDTTVDVQLERAATLRGSMRTAETDAPITSGWIEVFSSNGSKVGTVQSTSDGSWVYPEGLQSGSYFVRGAAAGHSVSLFDGIACPPGNVTATTGRCNPLTGTAVPLVTGSTAVVDLKLHRARTISGRVTATGDAYTGGLLVMLWSNYFCVLYPTDPDGHWQSDEIPSDTYFASMRSSAFAGQAYDRRPCTGSECELSMWTPIPLGTADITNIDFHLTALKGGIRGRVTDRSSGAPLRNVTFTLGSAGITTDADGRYSIPLSPGSYAGFHASHPLYVTHAPGGGDCAGGTCPASPPIDIADTYVTRDFTMVARPVIRGRLTDAVTGGGLAGSLTVERNGVSSTVQTSQNGDYLVAFDTGDSVRLLAAAAGYLPLPWGGTSCAYPAGCSIVRSAVIPIGTGQQFADFALTKGAVLRFTVRSGETTYDAGVTVANVSGQTAGEYGSSYTVAAGRYFAGVLTYGFVRQIYDSIICDPCDLRSGTPIDVIAGEERHIVFDVELQGALKGRVVDRVTGLPISDAVVYVNGVVHTSTRADGRYRVDYVTSASARIEVRKPGYATQFYSGLDCERTCPAGQATVLDTSNGRQYTGIDFQLSPHLISRVIPAAGPASGGTPVVIHGYGFQPGATVTIGDTPAQVTWVSERMIHAVTAPHAEGQADVVVVNPDGHAARFSRGYRYGTAVHPVQPANLRSDLFSSGSHPGGIVVDGEALFYTINNVRFRFVRGEQPVPVHFPIGSDLPLRLGTLWVNIRDANPGDGQTLSPVQGAWEAPPIFASAADIRIVASSSTHGFFHGCRAPEGCGYWSVDDQRTVRFMASSPQPVFRAAAIGATLYVAGNGELVRLNAGESPVQVLSGGPGLAVSALLAAGSRLWMTLSDPGRLDAALVSNGAPGDGEPLTEAETISGVVEHQGLLWFCASPMGQQCTAWSTDGTRAGTLARHTAPGFRPEYAISLGDFLYYTWEGTLWRMNASTPPTAVFVLPGGSINARFAQSNGVLYFIGSKNLYRSDGTAEGTRRLDLPLSASSVDELTPFSGGVAFVTRRGSGGDVWFSDGTESGSFPLASAGPAGSIAADRTTMFGITGAVIGISASPLSGGPVTRTDGTAAGSSTSSVFASCDPDTAVAIADSVLVSCGGRLTAVDDSTVTDLGAWSVPLPAGNLAWFERGTGVWRTDGTVAGTFQVSGSADLVGVASPFAFFVAGGVLMRSAGVDASAIAFSQTAQPLTSVAGGTPGRTWILRGQQLWSLAHTATQAVLETTLPAGMHLLGGTSRGVFARGIAGPGQRNPLWFYDGTWRQLSDEATSASRIATQGVFLTPANGGPLLLYSDGTPAGTVKIEFVTVSKMLEVYDGVLLFIGDDGWTGPTLWRSNGTLEGTYPVFDHFERVSAAVVWNGTLIGMMFTPEWQWEPFSAGPWPWPCGEVTAVTAAPVGAPAGTSATLRATASGIPPLHFQWYRGAPGDVSQPVATDAAGQAVVASSGSYWFRVHSPCGQADSGATIVEIGRQVTIAFRAAASRVSESASPAAVEVELVTADAQPLVFPVSVQYGGSFDAGWPMPLPLSGTVTFAAGSASGSISPISVALPARAERDGSRRLSLELTSPSGAALGLSRHVLTVLDDQSYPGHFFTINPCRAYDSRSAASLRSGDLRGVALTACGVPVSARAVALNVTVVTPSAAGHLTLFAHGAPRPATSTLNFSAGQVRANFAVVPLPEQGPVINLAPAIAGNGTVHVVVDVTGYFE